MENAADALKMAADVLIFLLALTISINAFGQVRVAAQTILNDKDREQYDQSYYVDESESTERKVSIETIVPTIYKAYKENYKIVFNTTKIGNKGLYQKKGEDGNPINIFSIDLENEVLGSDRQKEEFIYAILYGADTDIINKFYRNLGITLYSEGIYGKIKGEQFIERLGVYYQEELQGSEQQDAKKPEANKTKKRVITYSDS